MLLSCTIFISKASLSISKADIPDLSNNAILCIHQDQNGYMWFGTYDGLNLFNGKDTYIYRLESDNPNTLSSNIIHKITNAEPGSLWISTYQGLDKFSIPEKKVTETYREYSEARLLAANSKGYTLILKRNDFISCYSPETKTIQDIHVPGIHIDQIITIYTDSKDNFQILTNKGTIIDIIPDFRTTPTTLELEEHVLHPKPIEMVSLENHFFYIVDTDKQLYLYNLDDKQKIFLSDLTSVIEKNGKLLQISHINSEIYLIFDNGHITPLTEPHKEEKLNVGIFCTLKDAKQDILWIGTDGQGVRKFYKKHHLFGTLLSDKLPLPLFKPIRSLLTDSLDNLWVGTKGDGIVCISHYSKSDGTMLKEEQVRHYTQKNGLSNDKVYSFLKSRYHDILYIGTDGPGLSYYSYKTNQIHTLAAPPHMHINKVHSICELNDSTLWVATAGDGLKEVYLNTQGKELSVRNAETYTFMENNQIYNEFHSMLFMQDSVLLLGSRGGYGPICFDIRHKTCKFIPMDFSGNSAIGDILCVHASEDSVYYFGASSGMTRMKFLPDGTNRSQQFTHKNGLANDMIHGILEDAKGCIWLSTNKGLTKYNPHNDFFHNYGFPDLKVWEFSDDAYWKCPYSGRLFFGGINGLVWIEPHTANTASYKPELHFYELRMSDETYDLTNYTADKTKTVKIPPGISSFTISFVATDYIDGENYEYSYLLENHNTTWTELKKENKVTFTQLPYGKYRLRVKYKNDVFDSGDENHLLYIEVLPPWYRSNWATISYLITILLLCIYGSWMLRLTIIRKQQSIAQKVQEEERKKLYEAKLNFFTNITHELCTPLALINGVSNNFRQYMGIIKDDAFRKGMDILSDNIRSLDELIREILDFRKIEEAGMQQCHIRKISISDLIKRQAISFTPIAEHHQIRFEYEIPDNLYWNTDPACFKKIIVNLISNAFKYTEKKGYIRVTVSISNSSNRTLLLKVYNTGQGIENSKLKEIFNRYYILDGMEENTYAQTTSRNGLGLYICHSLAESLQGEIKVQSEAGKYAEFTVMLPYLEADAENSSGESEQNTGQVPQKTVSETDIRPGTSLQKILVIDDNKDIVWLIASSLSDDYTVLEAYSGREALEIIENQTPVLIITDIMMPDMNGLELVKIIRENKFTCQIPIVIVSAKITENEQAEGLNIGADAYLTKPFSPLVLQSVVNRLVSNKKEMKKYYYSPESNYVHTDGLLLHQEDKAFMDKINTIIRENIDQENLWPDILTEKTGLSTRNFYRKFKKISSLTPTDFIKNYRFTYAAQLLITTNLTIQEIIYKVGISSKAYFYREFAQKFNMTPTAYRQRK